MAQVCPEIEPCPQQREARMPNILHSRRLELTLMEPAFLEALRDGDRRRAEEIGGFSIPEDLSIKPRTLSLRLQQIREDPEVHPWLLRAIVIKASRTMCGYINFHSAPGSDDLLQFAPHAVELGYTIAPSFRRQGYAKEAAITAMRWAFEQHGVRSFVLSISPTNEASLALARSLQFAPVGSQTDAEDGPEWVFTRHLDCWPDDWETIIAG